jgi:FkbM family methyltransferase
MTLLARALGLLPPALVRAVSRARWKLPWLHRPLEWVADRTRHRDGVIAHGAGKGLRFNVGPSNAGYLLGTAEPETQRLLGLILQSGMTFFDGGANVGFLSVIAARLVGPTGHVVCFEPLAANADLIEHNVRLNGLGNVRVRREALGETDGTASFRVSPYVTKGQLASSVYAKPTDQVVEEIPVPVRSLDSLWREGSLPPPAAIKLDIEGSEAEAIRGATGLIAATRPVLLVELHDTNAAVADQLDRIGYRAYMVDDPRPLREARWNANLVAVPAERESPPWVRPPFASGSAAGPATGSGPEGSRPA